MENDQDLRNRIFREAILKLPAQAPPPGVIPNFEHPSTSMYVAITTATSVTLALATLLVAVKMYTQIRIYRKVYIEDYCLTIALALFCFAVAPIVFILRRLPVGIHQWETRMGPFIQHLFYWYCTLILWVLVMVFLKIAIMLQLLRVFVPVGVRNSTFWATQINLWVNTVFNILYIFLSMFSCSPRAAFWDVTIKGRCLDHLLLNVVDSVVCLSTDIIILFLPQRAIFSLRLPLKRKIGLSFIFAFGVLGCTASAARTYFHYKLWKERSDFTYTLARVGLWGSIQLMAGFLCAGLPAIPKFMNLLRKTPFGSRLETSLRSLLRRPLPETSQGNAKVVTIGGGNGNQIPRPEIVSDIEFQELVVATDGTDNTIGVDSVLSVPEAGQRPKINISQNVPNEGDDHWPLSMRY